MVQEILLFIPFPGKWPGGERGFCYALLYTRKSSHPHSSPSVIILLCWAWPRNNLDSTWCLFPALTLKDSLYTSNTQVNLLLFTYFFLSYECTLPKPEGSASLLAHWPSQPWHPCSPVAGTLSGADVYIRGTLRCQPQHLNLQPGQFRVLDKLQSST